MMTNKQVGKHANKQENNTTQRNVHYDNGTHTSEQGKAKCSDAKQACR